MYKIPQMATEMQLSAGFVSLPLRKDVFHKYNLIQELWHTQRVFSRLPLPQFGYQVLYPLTFVDQVVLIVTLLDHYLLIYIA